MVRGTKILPLLYNYHTIRWSIDWGDRFSSEEYRDEGEEERVEGAGEESIGSLEDTGH